MDSGDEIVQDNTFYFDNVVFQAGYVLFKLPRQLLAGSGVFVDMFALPPGENNQEEGRDNEHPIKLPGVTAEEFRGFLKTIHPMTHDADDVKVADRETWTSCLKLATLWNIDRMRKKSICKLDQFKWDAVDKIVTAKRYHVSWWLIEGYVEVLQRHRLSVEEVRRLVPIFGMETVCLLLAVKERRWCSVMEHYGSVSEQRLDQYNFIQDVCEVFEEELKQDEEYTAPKNPPPKNPGAILEDW